MLMEPRAAVGRAGTGEKEVTQRWGVSMRCPSPSLGPI